MRSVTFIAVAAAVALLIAGAAGVYAYDHGREHRIADGVTVGGIDVGGLERPAAVRKLRQELLGPLESPVVVRSRGHRFTLTAKRAQVHADLDAMVDEAIARSREGNILGRTLRGLTGGRVDADIDPEISYSRAAVRKLVRRVEDKIERPAVDAKVEFSADSLGEESGHDGLRVDGRRLRKRVARALLRPSDTQRIVTASVEHVDPKVTKGDLADKYGTVILVDRAAHTLRLFKDLDLVKSYPIAVGQIGLETPAGLYHIQNKAVNPAWNVPDSDWAGDLAGHVIPGGAPDNPLKARWMGIYAGAGIHGTDNDASIGSSVSHGCIRMHIPDVIELYDRVPVGTPIYIG